jgi:hypothetical protein
MSDGLMAFTSSFGDINISCMPESGKIFLYKVHSGTIYLNVLSILLPFPRKTFIIFPDPVLSASMTIEDSMQIDIQSSRLMSITDIYNL